MYLSVFPKIFYFGADGGFGKRIVKHNKSREEKGMKIKKEIKRWLAAATVSMLALGTLAGCGNGGEPVSVRTGNGEAAQDGTVTLKWVTIGNGMPDNYDSWVAKVNEYTGEKIGVHIEMEVIPWGSWDDRRNIIISTNEPYDIIFGNGKNYVPDITLGAYCDITDMV